MIKDIPCCGRRALQDSCPVFKLPVADFAAESTAKCTLFDVTESERGFKRKRTDPVTGFLIDIAKVPLSIKGSQR